jgi:hypothetical protein
MLPFGQSLCQAQISILEIFHIFLRLKFSPSLILAKIEYFSKVSLNIVGLFYCFPSDGQLRGGLTGVGQRFSPLGYPITQTAR